MIPYSDFARLLTDTAEYTDFDQYVAECGGSVPLNDVSDVLHVLRIIWAMGHEGLTIKTIAAACDRSVRSFYRDYGIPVRTLENWSINVRTSAPYVLPLVAYAATSDYTEPTLSVNKEDTTMMTTNDFADCELGYLLSTMVRLRESAELLYNAAAAAGRIEDLYKTIKAQEKALAELMTDAAKTVVTRLETEAVKTNTYTNVLLSGRVMDGYQHGVDTYWVTRDGEKITAISREGFDKWTAYDTNEV